jgi:Type II secretion system (T2SS), protein M subtype b
MAEAAIRTATGKAGAKGDGRFSSLLVLIAIIMAGAVAAFLAWSDWQTRNVAEGELRVRAETLEAAADARAKLDGGDTARPDGEALLVPGPATALVVADVQKRLEAIIAETGATLRSADAPRIILPEQATDGSIAPATDGLSRIVLAVDIEAGEQALPDLLLAVERARPVLIITGLTIKTPRQVGTEWIAGAEQRLSLRLEVAALSGTEPKP